MIEFDCRLQPARNHLDELLAFMMRLATSAPDIHAYCCPHGCAYRPCLHAISTSGISPQILAVCPIQKTRPPSKVRAYDSKGDLSCSSCPENPVNASS